MYVVNANGVAEIRPVIVGDYVGEQDIVVVQGLHAGDRVVVDGVLKVVPGKPVSIVAAPAAAASAPRPRRRLHPPPPPRRLRRRRSSPRMFTHFFIDRPILSSVISILIVLAGAVAMSVSPIEQYPELAPPKCRSARYPARRRT